MHPELPTMQQVTRCGSYPVSINLSRRTPFMGFHEALCPFEPPNLFFLRVFVRPVLVFGGGPTGSYFEYQFNLFIASRDEDVQYRDFRPHRLPRDPHYHHLNHFRVVCRVRRYLCAVFWPLVVLRNKLVHDSVPLVNRPL